MLIAKEHLSDGIFVSLHLAKCRREDDQQVVAGPPRLGVEEALLAMDAADAAAAVASQPVGAPVAVVVARQPLDGAAAEALPRLEEPVNRVVVDALEARIRTDA